MPFTYRFYTYTDFLGLFENSLLVPMSGGLRVLHLRATLPGTTPLTQDVNSKSKGWEGQGKVTATANNLGLLGPKCESES